MRARCAARAANARPLRPTMNDQPLVSVCIVSYNTRDLLRACLRSVAARAPDAELVVVDNASPDGSAALVAAEFPRAKLIANPTNRGFAAAMNQALRAAGGRYLLLLNPDAELVGDALDRLVAFLAAHPRVAAVGPRLVYGDGRPQHAAFAFPTLWQVLFDLFPELALRGRLLDSRLNGRYPPARAPHPIDHPLGACMLVRREALEDVGPLDEGFFMYAEEVDWCLRAKRRGWEVYHVPDALAVHHAGQATRQLRGRMFVELHRSRFRLYRKHYPPAFRVAAAALTRLGAWAEARRAERLAARGALDAAQLAEWRAACRAVAALAAASRRRLAEDAGRDASPAPIHLAMERGPGGEAPNPTITGAVLARDEAAVLDDCLRSLAWVDELLVVVDAATTDATAAIARRHGARVVVRPLTSFPDQRNAALALARTDWLLFVDADERVPPALAAEVRRTIARPGEHVGYWVPRHNYIFGRRMRGGGWWPDYQPRLFRVGRAHFDPDRLVHELAVFDGPSGRLREPLLHLNYDDLADFLAKQRRYRALEAERRFRAGVRPRLRSFLGLPARELYRRFVALRGYRDGPLGLLLALLLAWNELRTLQELAARWRAHARSGRVGAA